MNKKERAAVYLSQAEEMEKLGRVKKAAQYRRYAASLERQPAPEAPAKRFDDDTKHGTGERR